jgi:hypothetical protein
MRKVGLQREEKDYDAVDGRRSIGARGAGGRGRDMGSFVDMLEKEKKWGGCEMGTHGWVFPTVQRTYLPDQGWLAHLNGMTESIENVLSEIVI